MVFHSQTSLLLKKHIFHYEPSEASFSLAMCLASRLLGSQNCADREDVHCADREDVRCADREDAHCTDSHTPIHEGIHLSAQCTSSLSAQCTSSLSAQVWDPKSLEARHIAREKLASDGSKWKMCFFFSKK